MFGRGGVGAVWRDLWPSGGMLTERSLVACTFAGVCRCSVCDTILGWQIRELCHTSCDGGGKVRQHWKFGRLQDAYHIWEFREWGVH
jgi:hypothetical protein